MQIGKRGKVKVGRDYMVLTTPYVDIRWGVIGGGGYRSGTEWKRENDWRVRSVVATPLCQNLEFSEFFNPPPIKCLSTPPEQGEFSRNQTQLKRFVVSWLIHVNKKCPITTVMEHFSSGWFWQESVIELSTISLWTCG